MSDSFVQAIETEEIAPGGMKAVEVGGREVVICNCDGTFYAIERRCGHMNAPLEMGTLAAAQADLLIGRMGDLHNRRAHFAHPIQDVAQAGRGVLGQA